MNYYNKGNAVSYDLGTSNDRLVPSSEVHGKTFNTVQYIIIIIIIIIIN